MKPALILSAAALVSIALLGTAQAQTSASRGAKAGRDCVPAGTATESEPGPNAVVSRFGTCPKGMVPRNPTASGAASSVNGVPGNAVGTVTSGNKQPDGKTDGRPAAMRAHRP